MRSLHTLGSFSALAVTGAVMGTGDSLVLMRFRRGLLSGVRPDDPAALVSVSALLAVVTIATCAIPAVRAVSVEVMESREE